MNLHWQQVAPSAHSFDASVVERVARREVLAALGGRIDRGLLGVTREQLAARINEGLVNEVGPWVGGWQWAASEPGGGGPVRAWCCAEDGLIRGEDADANGSVARVVAAVADWRAFLVELEKLFAQVSVAGEGASLEQEIELAAATLLPHIVARTSTEDAWYNTFAVALGWYVEARGHDSERAQEVLGELISGRFSSWVEPSADVAKETCAQLGARVAEALGPTQPVDALAAWREARERPPVFPRREARGAGEDAHLRFIEETERARDPRRAEAMLAALQACRESAKRGEPLTLALLSRWQVLVLGAPVDLRTTDAFAKGGRERYPALANLRSAFEACLAQADEAALPLSVRGARLYLDVCFFHPFSDGNARAARLALDHLLTRAGRALLAVEPLFVPSWPAGETSFQSFAAALERLLA